MSRPVTPAAIQRRLKQLESAFASELMGMGDYPPLTRDEIEDFEQRLRRDESLTPVDLHRLEKQSPITDGELLITCHKGKVFMKRYIGVDLAEL